MAVGLRARLARTYIFFWREQVIRRVLLAFVLLSLSCAAIATSYVYDAQGRLIAASNDAGESARYRYDAMGNIVAVERVASGTLAILGFSPARGAPGDRVLIQGNGFASVLGNNTVTFNGQAATLVSATSRELVVLVPAGASTGAISVKVGTETASSAQHFIVDANFRQPVILGVSPLVASEGAAITVQGQNLLPAIGQTSIKLDRKSVIPSSSTDTQVVFAVPRRSGSGPVTVSTPYGSATSSEDVLVVPDGVPTSSISSVTRVAVDAAAVDLSVSTEGSYAAVVVSGMAGDYLSAQFESMGATTLSYRFFGTENVQIASGSVNSTRPTLHLPRLKTAGTYLLLLKPNAASAGWKMAVERAQALALDGADTVVATAIAGQAKRYTFFAQAGDRLGLAIADRSPVGSGWGAALLQVFDANGISLGYQHCSQANNGCALNIAAPKAGVYQAYLSPSESGARTMNLNLVLSSDLFQALPKDESIAVEGGRRGQNLRLLFNANAGDAFALQVANQTTAPAGRDVYYRVYGPDGASVASMAVRTAGVLHVVATAPGAYHVLVDSGFGETVGLQARLNSGDSGGPVVDGGNAEFQTQLPVESVYFAFSAAAGQSLGLGISDLQSNENGPLSVTVYKPNGAPLAGASCEVANGGCDVNLPDLSAGRYGVIVSPASNTQTMRFNVTVSNDLAIALTRDSASQVAIGRRGQNAVLTFQGNAGEALALQVADQAAMPANGAVYYRVYRPDGMAMSSMAVSASGILTMNMPATGMYRVVMDPLYGAAVSSKVTLTTGTTGGLQLDASNGEYKTAAGQSAYFSFSATASQNLGLGISDLGLSSGTYVSVKIVTPSGSTLSTTTCYAANGCAMNLLNLAAGNYGVTVTPQTSSQTITFKATLSTEVPGFLQKDSLNSLEIQRHGQNARLTFTGAVGESVALLISDVSTQPAGRDIAYAVYRPNGALWKTINSIGSVTLALPNLPEAGNYRVFIDPSNGALLSAKVKLSTGQDGNVELDGSGGNYQAQAGQGVYFSIDTQAGQNLGLGISEVVVSSGNYINASVYKPDGTSLGSGSCYVDSGCSFNLTNTPAGRYSVVVTPATASQSMKFRAVLSSDVLEDLPRDQPLQLALPRHGQNARLRFQALAGESLMLLVAAQTTSPAGRNAYYRVQSPDGSIWKSLTAAVGGVISLVNLPKSGEYVVLVESEAGSPFESQVTLSTGTSLSIDGPSLHVVTRLPAQGTHLSFLASQGQSLGLGVNDVQIVGSGQQYVYARVYKADGSVLADVTCGVERGGCDFDLINLAAGKYDVLITQGDEQAVTFDVTLSSEVVASLQRDIPLAISVARRGQNARLTFQGQAGEKLAVLVQGQSTTPAQGSSYYSIYRPNGTLLASGLTRTGIGVGLGSLPVAGTYSVLVDPEYGQKIDTTVTLSTGAAIAVDSSQAFSTGLPGRNIFLTFDALAGQNLGLGLNQITFGGDGYGWVYVSVYRPDGTNSISRSNCFRTYGCAFSIVNAQAGRYGVIVAPSAEDQWFSLAATVSTSLGGSLSWDVAQSVALDQHGKTALFSFAGTAGQPLLLRVANQVTTPTGRSVSYAVYKPDGQIYRSISNSSINSDLSFATLPVSGNYQLRIIPEDGITSSMDVTLDSTP